MSRARPGSPAAWRGPVRGGQRAAARACRGAPRRPSPRSPAPARTSARHHAGRQGRRGAVAPDRHPGAAVGARRRTCTNPAAAAILPTTAPVRSSGYPILDLRPDRCDVHKYVRDLEEVMIRVPPAISVSQAARIKGLTGAWVGADKAGCDRRADLALDHEPRLRVQRDDRSRLSSSSSCPCGISKAAASRRCRARPGGRLRWTMAEASVIRHFAAVSGGSRRSRDRPKSVRSTGTRRSTDNETDENDLSPHGADADGVRRRRSRRSRARPGTSSAGPRPVPAILPVHFDDEGIADRFVRASYRHHSRARLDPVDAGGCVRGDRRCASVSHQANPRSAVEDEADPAGARAHADDGRGDQPAGRYLGHIPGSACDSPDHDVAVDVLRPRQCVLPECSSSALCCRSSSACAPRCTCSIRSQSCEKPMPRIGELRGLYVNRQDPALFVPLRSGVGWTLNLAARKPLCSLEFSCFSASAAPLSIFRVLLGE